MTDIEGRYKLLDLFCGAGGAAMGYHRAGFEVVGIDINPQPHYPFAFVRADALEYVAAHGAEYDAIHASPPCQGYSVTQRIHGYDYPLQIENVRRAIESTGRPYVMENVPQAPLINPLILCGTMFGLQLIRHRAFECNPPIWFAPATCACSSLYTNAAHGYSSFENGATAICVAGNNFRLEDGALAMGIDWMTREEMAEAIPPAYTEYIGKQLRDYLQWKPKSF